MITPTFEMKKAFFDRQKINDAVDRETRRALSKSLAYVRRRMRSGLRRRKRPSKPGQAPSVHSKNPALTLKAIFFAYDARTKSGVVGPVKLNGQRSLSTSNMALPGLLEIGGLVTIPEESYDGKTWVKQRRSRRISGRKKTRKRVVRIAPRPNSEPALRAEAEAGNILSPWANVVSN